MFRWNVSKTFLQVKSMFLQLCKMWHRPIGTTVRRSPHHATGPTIMTELVPIFRTIECYCIDNLILEKRMSLWSHVTKNKTKLNSLRIHPVFITPMKVLRALNSTILPIDVSVKMEMCLVTNDVFPTMIWIHFSLRWITIDDFRGCKWSVELNYWVNWILKKWRSKSFIIFGRRDLLRTVPNWFSPVFRDACLNPIDIIGGPWTPSINMRTCI